MINLAAEPRLGQVVTCQGCRQDFEVINLDPPKLDWVYDGIEDYWTVMDWDFTGTFPLPRGLWWGF
jgi:lysine biosynthesis protein LysW